MQGKELASIPAASTNILYFHGLRIIPYIGSLWGSARMLPDAPEKGRRMISVSG
jgi:hypothetical protein